MHVNKKTIKTTNNSNNNNNTPGLGDPKVCDCFSPFTKIIAPSSGHHEMSI